MIRRADIASETKVVRCAIYCRVSTDERLGQEFNSLHAQREAGEAFVLSRKTEGWTCLPDNYSDPGFSGATLDRPALQRLLADVAAGRVDCIVVYKVDRLSRSLLDFARLVEVLDQRRVTFVSVTQPISTADSSGRLMLHVLLSFAEFERSMVSDRTRDKMSAARRKGKWTGGCPVLGYDVHPDGGRLVVNEEEAEIVRAIFLLYLDHGSLLTTAEELNRRGWRTKSWRTKDGELREGGQFQKAHLSRLLSNPLYVGKVYHRGQLYDGEHPGVVDPEVFGRVQKLLGENRPCGGARARNRYGALLKGLLDCAACKCAMSPSSTKRGNRIYRYYTCCGATRNGWKTCPHPSLPAKQIEDAVVAQIRRIGHDPGLVAETLAQLKHLKATRQPALVAERRRLDRELARLRDRGRDEDADQIGRIEARLVEIAEELAVLQSQSIDKRDLAKALAMFDDVWGCLFPREQERVIGLLIERIEFDAQRETIAITFAPTGIRALADEVAEGQEVRA